MNHLEKPQLIIFKPDNEVAKRINEYFISHGVDKESSLKIDKLLQLRDPEILDIYIYIYIFGETWGIISSDEYINVYWSKW